MWTLVFLRAVTSGRKALSPKKRTLGTINLRPELYAGKFSPTRRRNLGFSTSDMAKTKPIRNRLIAPSATQMVRPYPLCQRQVFNERFPQKTKPILK